MNGLDEFRARLNVIDEEWVKLLGERIQICREVAHYKREHGVPMMQSARVEAVKERCADLAVDHNVDPDFVRNLYAMIIRETCRVENEIIDEA